MCDTVTPGGRYIHLPNHALFSVEKVKFLLLTWLLSILLPCQKYLFLISQQRIMPLDDSFLTFEQNSLEVNLMSVFKFVFCSF